MRPRIGIVGGVGPAATVLYYEALVAGYQERWAGQLYPEVIIHALDLAWVTQRFERDELAVLTDRVVEAVESLGGSGCSFGLFSCNAMHLVFDNVVARTELPLIDLRRLVVEKVATLGMDRVALLATTFTAQSGLYCDPLRERGIECLLPAEDDQAWLMGTINGELQRGSPRPESESRAVALVEQLAADGAQAVIIGCTDLPLLVHSSNSPLPVIDTAAIHVRAALDRALEDELAAKAGRIFVGGETI